MISCGFDAHTRDPLAHLGLEAEDYQFAALQVAALGLPVVVFAEGGYDLTAIEASMAATLLGLSGAEPSVSIAPSPQAAWRLIEQAREEAVASGAISKR